MARTLLVAFSSAEADSLVGFALALGQPFDVLQLCGAPSERTPAGKIMVAGLEATPSADVSGAAITKFASGYSHIAAVSNMRSKDILGRVTGLLDASMVNDVVAVRSSTVFDRPVMAGSIVATIEALSLPVVLTVRVSSFPAELQEGGPQIEHVTIETQGRVKTRSVSARTGSRPDLATAKVVVSGGRPLRNAETFEKVIGGLADKFGGAVGATRAAVDAGIAPNELQVGQTGKVVAPDLYIAAGISGSTQHMAGIKDSKIIVAINKDPDAPIFQMADLGLVADLFDALPALQNRIGQ